MRFDFLQHLKEQAEWSEKTFGPGNRTPGIVEHLREELDEVLEDSDISEWMDIVILALDGAWRSGYSPEQIIEGLEAKTLKNHSRSWPDWRQFTNGEPIKHVKGIHD